MRRAKLPATAWAVLLVGIGLTVLAACTGDAAPTAPPAVPTSHLPAATPEFDGSREPVDVEPSGQSLALLVDVRTASHGGFDRVVFEFDTSRPGYRVEYVSPPIAACGSGLPVEVAGAAFLQVRMSPAAAHDDAGLLTFDRQEITPGLPIILEVVQTCDFEGEVTWVAALTAEVDFVVSPVPGPFRVIVDLARP